MEASEFMEIKISKLGGREVLTKSVLQSIQAYLMSLFCLPVLLCDAIHKMLNSFWWASKNGDQRGINWQLWDLLCGTKMHGEWALGISLISILLYRANKYGDFLYFLIVLHARFSRL